jgi:hypothetical protein
MSHESETDSCASGAGLNNLFVIVKLSLLESIVEDPLHSSVFAASERVHELSFCLQIIIELT